MGASLKAEAISHLECVSPEGVRAMAEAGTTAVILPTTAFLLRLESPPVRDLIQAGVAVALGSDFNPNAYCTSMVGDGVRVELAASSLYAERSRSVRRSQSAED